MLNGKNAIVIGSTSGIGLGIARLCLPMALGPPSRNRARFDFHQCAASSLRQYASEIRL